MQHDHRDPSGRGVQQLGDLACVLGVGGDHQTAGVGVAVLADRPQPRVGLAQDPRQPVGQLGRDRRPVATAGLARGQDGVEPRLDHVVAAAPGQRPVIGDEADRPADPVGDRLGERIGDVGLGDPVAVVADPRDRGGVGAKRRPRQQQPAGVLGERRRKGDAPGELLAEMVGLVGDHQRAARQRARPSPRRPGDPRVGDRHAVEAGRRARRVGVGREVDAELVGGPRPLAGQRRGRACDHDRADRPGGQLRPGVLERGPGLAGPRRGRDEDRIGALPAIQGIHRALLPQAQRMAVGRGAKGGHGAVMVHDASDEKAHPPVRSELPMRSALSAER